MCDTEKRVDILLYHSPDLGMFPASLTIMVFWTSHTLTSEALSQTSYFFITKHTQVIEETIHLLDFNQVIMC